MLCKCAKIADHAGIGIKTTGYDKRPDNESDT